MTSTEQRLMRGIELAVVVLVWSLVFRWDQGADQESLLMLFSALFGISISQVSRPVVFRLGGRDLISFVTSRGFYSAVMVILVRAGVGLPWFPGQEALGAWGLQLPILAAVIAAVPRSLHGEVGVGTTAPAKRIAIWSVNYAPEEAGIAPQTVALAQRLKESGFQVTVVTTFAYYPEWKKRKQDIGKFHECQSLDGITIHRCWHYIPAKQTTLRRILHQLSFLMTSLYRLLLLERQELYVGVCPPFALGPLMRTVGLIKRSPFVLHVQDLEVQAAADLNQIPVKMVRFFRWFERWGYAGAARITTISRGMQKTLEGIIPGIRVELLPNQPRRFPHSLFPYDSGQMGRRLVGPRRVIYTGNIGEKQDLLTAVMAFRGVEGVELKIYGEGSAKAKLVEWLAQNPCNSVSVGPLIPAEDYVRVLDEADFCLICEKPGPENVSYFPSKLLVYLDLGRPVFLMAGPESELYQLNQEHDFALGIKPGETIQTVLSRLVSITDEELREWARRSRNFLPVLRGDADWDLFLKFCHRGAERGTQEQLDWSLRLRLFVLRVFMIPTGLIVLVGMHAAVRLLERPLLLDENAADI